LFFFGLSPAQNLRRLASRRRRRFWVDTLPWGGRRMPPPPGRFYVKSCGGKRKRSLPQLLRRTFSQVKMAGRLAKGSLRPLFSLRPLGVSQKKIPPTPSTLWVEGASPLRGQNFLSPLLVPFWGTPGVCSMNRRGCPGMHAPKRGMPQKGARGRKKFFCRVRQNPWQLPTPKPLRVWGRATVRRSLRGFWVVNGYATKKF